MKYSLVLMVLIAASFANANTFCNGSDEDEGELLSPSRRQVSIKNLKLGSKLLFAGTPVKIVDFYTTGGPEEGITVVYKSGKKDDLRCKDENTAGDN